MEAARKQGFQEGQAQANGRGASHRAGARGGSGGVARVRQQRRDYFRRVESEAVRLALSIARKVLHREAQMDPLLLAGVVRVALDQMQAGTRLVLRTSPDSAESWAEVLRAQIAGRTRRSRSFPTAVLKAARLCSCRPRWAVPRSVLESQLQEIESGFFDLSGEPPETTP